ncbi:MAG TPA: aspartyl protease [Cyanobacteria bacterium UBA11149]|nr:aspartyl protease [Cyanobacteria bacterium UBA11367]HBE58815.1 aspartyl protease [Cyanobacteria bacterium UBA11366]HBK64403.1 aspartyl protease [Cyanobacteria bacterium UBA11166]HBR73407.1 aspartyl protease [Cyanobacteria bacterium UBA11159]HBS68125.1 aspartyl protease [Cyanobacteria bacterium UBA11153]HBW92108.1 aspartyl protease [Cyanobacteria bacterium UBA11149]HCA97347.1 aspartyl protease [Cyanobacteria bacterium UBA9226]
MISGKFGEYGELFFEIELIASNGEIFPVEAILDTGFTTGYLAINFQDIEALEWPLIRSKIRLGTARGEDFFDLYEGRVIIDSQEFIIPAHVGDELSEILIGSQWLDRMELVVNKPRGILTLEIVQDL